MHKLNSVIALLLLLSVDLRLQNYMENEFNSTSLQVNTGRLCGIVMDGKSCPTPGFIVIDGKSCPVE